MRAVTAAVAVVVVLIPFLGANEDASVHGQLLNSTDIEDLLIWLNQNFTGKGNGTHDEDGDGSTTLFTNETSFTESYNDTTTTVYSTLTSTVTVPDEPDDPTTTVPSIETTESTSTTTIPFFPVEDHTHFDPTTHIPNTAEKNFIIFLAIAIALIFIVMICAGILLVFIMRNKESTERRRTHNSASSTHHSFPNATRQIQSLPKVAPNPPPKTAEAVAIVPNGGSGGAGSAENERLRVTNVNNPGLEPDHISAAHFRHHGALQLPETRSHVSLRHELDNDKTRSVHPSDHIAFDSKQFVVRDIGPGVEVVPNDDNTKPLDLGIPMPVQDDSQPRPPQPPQPAKLPAPPPPTASASSEK